VKALSLKATTKDVEELELTMEVNTIYTFFSSILIDELSALHKHVIYTDANALSEGKSAYFIGEQLLLGDALIVGKEGFNDIDASIQIEELTSLIKNDVNAFYTQALSLLQSTNINLYRTFLATKQDEEIPLNTEWVLYTFNIADTRTQEYFLNELQKALQAEEDVEEFMQKMAGLALNAGA
jgi:hypothetical protein